MRTRNNLILAGGALAGVLVLAGCGSSLNLPPLPVEVAFDTPPPNAVEVGSRVMVSASVSGKSSGGSVNWSASCANAGDCGTFQPAFTASGAATTYTAPSSVPFGGAVTIIATAAADSSRFAAQNVSVNTGGVVFIAFTAPPPPPTLTVSTGANFAAEVTSDPLSAGVDWSVQCAIAGACGGFSPAHTASGSLTTYTSPPTIPSGGTVTITGTSTTDPSKKVSAQISLSSVQPAAFLCAGCNYTFVLSGSSVNGPYNVAGVFQADGAGGIATGEQDFVEPGGTAVRESITSGAYALGPDGRGTITLITNDSRVGVKGTETLGVVLVSVQHAFLTEQDSFGTSSGTMDLQTITSFSLTTLAGAYAFVLSGQDFNNRSCGIQGCIPNLPFAIGGVMNVSSPGVISQLGSVVDSNDGGTIAGGQMHGSFQTPDSLGRVDIKLSLSFFSSTLEIAAYITDATHLKAVEIDNQLGNTSGVAIGQGASSGILAQPQAFAGPYVLAVLGGNPLGNGAFIPVALAAQFTAASGMIANGTSDVNLFGTSSSGNLAGSYSIDPAGTGRVGVTLSGNNGNLSKFALYLSGGSGPGLLLGLDTVSSGFAYAQAPGPYSAASIQGPFALSMTAFDPSGTAETDVTGQELADGAGNLSGLWDLNVKRSPLPGQAATGNYTSNGSARFTGSITTIPTATRQFAYYLVSGSQVVFIETDSAGVALGMLQLQVPPF